MKDPWATVRGSLLSDVAVAEEGAMNAGEEDDAVTPDLAERWGNAMKDW
jgi:hypothetical protein